MVQLKYEHIFQIKLNIFVEKALFCFKKEAIINILKATNF